MYVFCVQCFTFATVCYTQALHYSARLHPHRNWLPILSQSPPILFVEQSTIISTLIVIGQYAIELHKPGKCATILGWCACVPTRAFSNRDSADKSEHDNKDTLLSYPFDPFG